MSVLLYSARASQSRISGLAPLSKGQDALFLVGFFKGVVIAGHGEVERASGGALGAPELGAGGFGAGLWRVAAGIHSFAYGGGLRAIGN